MSIIAGGSDITRQYMRTNRTRKKTIFVSLITHLVTTRPTSGARPSQETLRVI